MKSREAAIPYDFSKEAEISNSISRNMHFFSIQDFQWSKLKCDLTGP